MPVERPPRDRLVWGTIKWVGTDDDFKRTPFEIIWPTGDEYDDEAENEKAPLIRRGCK